MPEVTLICGSESDRELVERVEEVLQQFGVEFESHVASAHRNPEKVRQVVAESDAEVFIAVAGLSAALPGFVASHTLNPVVGLPKEAKLLGIDSLLAMVQMPPGVPVATVGIDNAKNAALLAVEILSIKKESLKDKLEEYRLSP